MTNAKPINATQQALFALYRKSSFNSFDGDQVVDDLIAHPDWWQAAHMPSDGHALRDLPDDFYHVDTLYLLAASGHESKLEALAHTWNADEVDWLPPEQAGKHLGEGSARTRTPRLVLRVWWD